MSGAGELVVCIDADYDKEFKIEDLSGLQRVVSEELVDYRRELENLAETSEMAGTFLRQHRDPAIRDEGGAYSVLGIMPELREQLLVALQGRLQGQNVQLRLGGQRTIDITHRNVGKRQALEHYRQNCGDPDLLFLYFGSEFRLDLADDGSVRVGSDMEVLALDGLLAFAINADQDSVHSLGQAHQDRVTAAGSGGQAAQVWLRFMIDAACAQAR